MPSLEEALAATCNLAHDYATREETPRELFLASGYMEHRETIDVPMLRAHVAEHPEIVQQWMELSENKRTSGGYYIVYDAAAEKYLGGYLPAQESTRYAQDLHGSRGGLCELH